MMRIIEVENYEKMSQLAAGMLLPHRVVVDVLVGLARPVQIRSDVSGA